MFLTVHVAYNNILCLNHPKCVESKSIVEIVKLFWFSFELIFQNLIKFLSKSFADNRIARCLQTFSIYTLFVNSLSRYIENIQTWNCQPSLMRTSYTIDKRTGCKNEEKLLWFWSWLKLWLWLWSLWHKSTSGLMSIGPSPG